VARHELRDVERLLERLNALKRGDSKLDQFLRSLQVAADDGRACLVFSEFTDTVEYLRDALFPRLGSAVACYTGDGGLVFAGGKWARVSKEEITVRLGKRDLRVLLCSDAASEGLNLQVASALVNYDLPWNPARVEQRIGRVDRIGQLSADIRIVNLVLADSVDERVYQVLSQRCSLFESYVGSMQPVLSVARQMLLGVRLFDAAELNAEADRTGADALSIAAFEGTEERPPEGPPPGVTIEDLVRAHSFLWDRSEADAGVERGRFAASAAQLAKDSAAIPLSPFIPEVRRIARDLLQPGERVPLVLGGAEHAAFRVVAAAWAGNGTPEIVHSAERLEALLGIWNGGAISEDAWREAHTMACREAWTHITAMIEHAAREERTALERQVGAAQRRLLRELGRFLAAAATSDETLNSAFHRSMMRGGQVGSLLARAHALVGYPDWPDNLDEEMREYAKGLAINQRANLLLGTPLEAAVRDPRWIAKITLEDERGLEAAA